MASPAARLPAPLVLGAQPDGGEGGLDGIRAAQVNPVLGREVEVAEQYLAVLEQLLDRLRVLGAVGLLVRLRCSGHQLGDAGLTRLGRLGRSPRVHDSRRLWPIGR